MSEFCQIALKILPYVTNFSPQYGMCNARRHIYVWCSQNVKVKATGLLVCLQAYSNGIVQMLM